MCSSRTDAGVHAVNNVISVDLVGKRDNDSGGNHHAPAGKVRRWGLHASANWVFSSDQELNTSNSTFICCWYQTCVFF